MHDGDSNITGRPVDADAIKRVKDSNAHSRMKRRPWLVLLAMPWTFFCTTLIIRAVNCFGWEVACK